jgi:hypothetical protein
MRIRELLESENQVRIDNINGWGSTPNNGNINYLGLRVLMTPSAFIKLAATLSEPRSSSDIATHIKQDGAIGSPFLILDIPEEWEEGNFDNTAKVKGHEGRNRMIAILQVFGDRPLEVHLFPRGMRRRHLTDEMIAQLNNGMIKEQSSSEVISGPLFKLIN